MAQTTINPMGTDGFEFVEYTAPNAKGIADLKNLFSLMGFADIAKHKHKDVWLYRQGDINFIVNGEIDSQAQGFAKVHGARYNCQACAATTKPEWQSRSQAAACA